MALDGRNMSPIPAKSTVMSEFDRPWKEALDYRIYE